MGLVAMGRWFNGMGSTGRMNVVAVSLAVEVKEELGLNPCICLAELSISFLFFGRLSMC